MRKEPSYLTENKIRIISPNGGEISPASVNWNSDEATRYTFRQDPGGDFNSLGFVRINIPSPHGVYMHDTPSKGIFGDDFRFVSSGCMRVQNVRDYVAWLLKDTPGWDRARIDETIQSGQRVNARIARSRVRATGSTSPPGRRPMAACSSATTSTTRTASAPRRSQPCRAIRISEASAFAASGKTRRSPAGFLLARDIRS